MRKKLKKIAVACLLATSLLTVEVGAASKDVSNSINTQQYGKLTGTLDKGGADARTEVYYFSFGTSVKKKSDKNAYVIATLDIQNAKTGKTVHNTYARGWGDQKKCGDDFELDCLKDYKKIKFSVFGAHEVRGKYSYVCYTKNTYKYTEDLR